MRKDGAREECEPHKVHVRIYDIDGSVYILYICIYIFVYVSFICIYVSFIYITGDKG